MAVDITPSALLEFAKTIKGNAGSTGNARVATVTRIDKDGVAYVSLPGGVDETPLATSGALLGVGDTVYVTMSGGKLRAVNNYTEPSIGSNVVRRVTSSIEQAVRNAKKTADEAEAVAVAVNQHFWDDDNGAHVTDVTQDEWKHAVDDGFSDLSDSKQYNNLLMNSLGILLRSALNNLVSITRSAIAFYDGLGNNAANIVAQFGTSGAQIGYADECHVEIDNFNLQLVNSNGQTYYRAGDLRDSSGYATVQERFLGNGSNTEFTVSYPISGAPTVTVNDVSATIASVGTYKITLSSAPATNATVMVTYQTLASGIVSITFGTRFTGRVVGEFSVTEGESNVASAKYSRASGYSCFATGKYSSAQGKSTRAQGECSIAQNLGTYASSDSQTAIGKYNKIDGSNNYAFIIGNGTSDSQSERSDALTVDWSGHINTDEPLIKTLGATSSAITLNAGSGTSVDVNFTVPTGYELIGVTSINQAHNIACSIGGWYIYDYNTVRVYVTNRSTSNFTDETVEVVGLFAWSGIA